MLAYIWPILLVVGSNVVYHIAAKSLPDNVSPFSALTITYLIGALCSAILFFLTDAKRDTIGELSRMGWAPYVLGIVVVGLEAGFLYAYKVGWQVSTATIVQSALQSAALLFVGYLLFHEALTWNKLVGIAICMVGLVFINLK